MEGQSPLAQQFTRWKLWKNWSHYVGESIAKHSEPGGYSYGKLYIHVYDSVWLQHLLFFKDQIKSEINTKLGFEYVKEVFLESRRRPVEDSQREFIKKNLNQIDEST